MHRRRIVFAKRVPRAQHLSRHAAADLFLDTLTYGAHSTATDALAGGLPFLTLAGGWVGAVADDPRMKADACGGKGYGGLSRITVL